MVVGKPILVVEDDKQISAVLTMILTAWSWSVEVAPTLARGQDLIRTGRYGHLILDLMLPDGDGSLIFEDIRRLESPVKVVVTSAIATQRQDELFGLGASAVLSKPFSLEALKAALE